MSEAALAVLRSIDQSLKELVSIARRQAPVSGKQERVEVADDRDLDGQFGNGPVTFDPRDWTGPSCKGMHLSECPPEFLDMLAEVYDYFAGKADSDGDAKKAGYKRKDAARARGWAQRIRSGGYKPAAQEELPEWS